MRRYIGPIYEQILPLGVLHSPYPMTPLQSCRSTKHKRSSTLWNRTTKPGKTHLCHQLAYILYLRRDVPYSPSFILHLTTDVDERIRHIIDFVFLPGFNNPTIAVLFQQSQTWTG